MNATNPQRSRKFNPLGPAGYLITFHTYGTWLHGDECGSVDRKSHNVPGTPVIEPDPILVRFETRRLKQYIHVVITALKLPEPVMNSIKSWCTRRMRENGLWKSDYSPWSRHGIKCKYVET